MVLLAAALALLVAFSPAAAAATNVMISEVLSGSPGNSSTVALPAGAPAHIHGWAELHNTDSSPASLKVCTAHCLLPAGCLGS
jgi:hypothetical protein